MERQNRDRLLRCHRLAQGKVGAAYAKHGLPYSELKSDVKIWNAYQAVGDVLTLNVDKFFVDVRQINSAQAWACSGY